MECDSFELTVTTHFADFPTQSYARLLTELSTVKSMFPNQTITFGKLKQSLLEFKVYYDQTSYKLIVQNESLSLIDLIASLGGTLGNWVSTNDFVIL